MTPFQTKRRRFAVEGAGGLLLVLVALVLLNVLANWVYFRVDLTQQKAYSLSKASKRLVRGMDDRVVIKVFFTPDLPAPYNSYSRYVRDLLTEYQAASHGHLRYEFVLPNPPKDFEQRAAEVGMQPVEFRVAGNDQYQVRRGFMGMVLYYGDKTETIPVIKGIENLEYEITSKLAKMVRRQKKVVAFTTGHGEVQWQSPQSPLAQDLSALYDIKTVSLAAGSTAPVQADALFVVGPTQHFDEKSLWVIDQAIMHGIPTAFFVDAKNVMLQQFIAAPLDNGLRPLLERYGAKLGTELVFDAQCQTVTVTQNVGGFSIPMSIPYPYLLSVTSFAQNHPLSKDLLSVVLPFTTDVESAAPPGVHFTSILYSSLQSWHTPAGVYRIGPDSIEQPHSDEPHGPYILAGVWDGRFPSYFDGKPSPVPGEQVIPSSPPTSIFVLGTSKVFDPQFSGFPGSENLVTNAMAFMSHDETLLGIHTKSEILRPLRPESGAVRSLIKAICTVGDAGLAALLGLLLWRRRRHRLQWISAGFTKT